MLRAVPLLPARKRVEVARSAGGDHDRRLGTNLVREDAGVPPHARRGEVNDQAVSANSSRPISMRRISLVPAPIS
jgi:hypothetical protein